MSQHEHPEQCNGDGYRKIFFEAEIRLSPDEIESGEGSIEQAVQNEVGHTGAVVLAAFEIDPHTGEVT